MTDPFDLQRFLHAQTPIYARVVAELRRGQKQSHWMWFIFPQLAGLGHSAMAQRFAIASREEAVAYLGHAILGSRLKEVRRSSVLLRAARFAKSSAVQTTLKFQSSMTLFSAVSWDSGILRGPIGKFYGGKPDQRTLDILLPKRT